MSFSVGFYGLCLSTLHPHFLPREISFVMLQCTIGTSLRNYIDPRVFKAWTDEVGVEWEKLYTAALQKKFLWVKNEDVKWKDTLHNI